LPRTPIDPLTVSECENPRSLPLSCALRRRTNKHFLAKVSQGKDVTPAYPVHEPPRKKVCKRCEKGRCKKKCQRNAKCDPNIKKRSPKGVNLQKIAKKAAKAEKKVTVQAEKAWRRAAAAAKKKGEEPPKPPEPPQAKWEDLDGRFYMAVATDGRGHSNGECKYRVTVPPEDFGMPYPGGAEVRFTEMNGHDARIISLPMVVPPGQEVEFILPVHPMGAGGRTVLATGLQIRRAVL